MPVQTSEMHIVKRELPLALRARMESDGLTQIMLSRRLSVSQPEISRALSGKRKRMTQSMRRLCIYAGLIGAEHEDAETLLRLNALVAEIVGGSDEAARIVERTLLSLAPAIAALRNRS